MSESVSVDEGWEEPLDSDQVTHVKGEAAAGEWLVNVSEQVVVPMTTTDVVEALRARRITDRSLVWRAGMQDWTALGDVPSLRLAAGKLAAPPERVLHPPSKEPAKAARDDRRRRNTLPFGFPVSRDPATIREPAGLARPAAPAAAAAPLVAAPKPPAKEDSGALAIYERATPSLTFSDSVRAEWQGTAGLVHQAVAPSAVPPPSAAPRPTAARQSPVPSPPAPPPPVARATPKRPEPKLEPRPRLSLEPQSDPKPRLSLEPQSDPVQEHDTQVEPMKFGSQPPPHSLSPLTSEPENALPARGAGQWGDLSVVLASDLRAVKASSKRLTFVASIGSAALASLLTLWFAHSYATARHAPEAAAQPPAAEAPAAKLNVAPAAPPVEVLPPIVSAAPAASAHPSVAASSVAASSAAAVHAVAKPAVSAVSAPHVVAIRPKPASASASEADAPASSSDGNPYADPPEHTQPKMPTAAFKETTAAPRLKPDDDAYSPRPSAPNVPSGLEDGAKQTPPATTATPGF